MRVPFVKSPLVAFVTALALALSIAAIAPRSSRAAGGDSWPQFQYGPTHTGFNPAEHILTVDNVGGLSLAWHQPVGAPIEGTPLGQPLYGTPIVSGGRVFALGFYGGLFAYRESDGRGLWSASLGVPASSITPVVYGTRVIAAGGQWDKGGTVAAFGVGSGRRAWSTHLPDTVDLSSPVLYGGNVYVGAGGTLYALSARTGKILWTRFLHGDTMNQNGLTGPVAVSGDGAYVVAATGDGGLYAVARASGQIAWSTTLGGGIYRGGVAISGGIGYVANGAESSEGGGFQLYAFEVGSGDVLWHQECGDDVHVTPSVGYGMVFVGAINGTLHAIDAQTGEVRWVVYVPGEVWASDALANGVLYAGTESALLALDPSTGRELFRAVVASGYAAMSSPAVTGGRVFVGTGEGEVLVFGLPQ